MTALLHDIRFALRLLWRRPAFTLVLIAVLGAGIGATGAMYSVLSSILLRPLPYPDPDRLVVLWAPQPFIDRAPLSGPDFADWSKATSFESMAVVQSTNLNLVENGAAERVSAARVSAKYFDVLGIRPVMGRSFAAEDDRPGSRVAVVSDTLWRRRFAADPALVGRTVSLDGEPHVIIGVLPPGHRLMGPYATGDVWIPLGLDPTTGDGQEWKGRGSHYLQGVARLRQGVSIATAHAELAGIAKQLEAAYPETNTGVGATIIPLHRQLVGEIRPMLVMLFAAVTFVLLVVCANVASLLLARAAARQTEMAMRVALGATRGRLVAQLLTESVVLALTGGAAGLLLMLWGVDAIASGLADARPRALPIEVDARAAAFTVAIAALTGLVFGIAPAISAARVDVYGALKEGGARASASSRQARLRNALVAAEVALATVLLVGAGLVGKGFLEVAGRDLGVDTTGVYTGEVMLPRASYLDDAAATRFQSEVLLRLRALPGVTAAGAIDLLPMSGNNSNGSIEIEGREPWPHGQAPIVERKRVSGGFFQAMGIALKKGRFITDDDRAGGQPVIVVNEAMVRKFWPNEDPIGRRIRWDTNELPYAVIIGVVGDVRSRHIEDEAPLESYVPFAQWPDRWMTFAVRAAPGAIGPKSIEDAVHAVDPLQPVFDLQTMDEVVSGMLSSRRFSVVLLGLFAAAAVALAAMGIVGVVSNQVAQRTREIGIRMALGADAGRVVRMVVGRSMAVVAAGLAIGSAVAVALAGAMATVLSGIGAVDPVLVGGVGALLALVAFGASWIPGSRAARISPAAALRYE